MTWLSFSTLQSHMVRPRAVPLLWLRHSSKNVVNTPHEPILKFFKNRALKMISTI